MPRESRSGRENEETRALIRHAFDLARTLGITTMLVQVDELQDVRLVGEIRDSETVLWLVRNPRINVETRRHDAVIQIPETGLTRLSQLNIGLFRAVLDERISLSESVVCLSGVAGSQRLDTLVIANPRRDFPWFRGRDVSITKSVVASREFGRLVDISLRLASEGREGKAIGTVFALGDPDELRPYLKQLILNPCEGHAQRDRNIHNEDFLESLREFSALDGAFVVNTKGVVESAGTYLDAPATKAALVPGSGARHAAALSFTSHTNSVAVVVSESSGSVTVFHDGQSILELERPKAVPTRKR